MMCVRSFSRSDRHRKSLKKIAVHGGIVFLDGDSLLGLALVLSLNSLDLCLHAVISVQLEE